MKDKVFENLDKDPREILKLVGSKALDWQTVQTEVVVNKQISTSRNADIPTFNSYRCFLDGSWKDSEHFSGIGWFISKAYNEDQPM